MVSPATDEARSRGGPVYLLSVGGHAAPAAAIPGVFFSFSLILFSVSKKLEADSKMER